MNGVYVVYKMMPEPYYLKVKIPSDKAVACRKVFIYMYCQIPFVIFVAVLGIIAAVANQKSYEKKMVYDLIPEILEEFECGLGYGKPEFPKFKSSDMIITDLKYTQRESGDTYKMFYVDGIVTITTLFGTQVDLDYQMRVGLDEEFEKTGKWYAEIIDGDVFE